MTKLEIAANAVTTVSILLAGRSSIHTWWTGIIGGTLFALLFYITQLYADVALQLFFVVTSIWGWMHWQQSNAITIRPVSRIKPQHLMGFAAASIMVALAYGMVLHRFTNAYAPFWDSAVLVTSVIAQFLLVRRKLETWIFWLIVNSIAVPLFYSRGLYLTSGLYAVYWINAIISWFVWRRQMLATAI